MNIVSLNVGQPRTVVWRDREVTTGIFKSPVQGPLMLRQSNLDGDRQADLENHGGRAKAVYAYPSEHYRVWSRELPDLELPWGMFGENLTTEGLDEEQTYIGDRFRIGQAIVMATQPRIPCFKLSLKFGRDDIVKRFLQSGRSGIYFAVLQEGLVEVGDTIECLHRDEGQISVAEVNRAVADGSENIPVMRRAVQHSVLPPGLKDHFLKELASTDCT